MKTNQGVMEAYHNRRSEDGEDDEEGFNWDEAVTTLLDFVRQDLVRKRYAKTGPQVLILMWLGIEMEDMELTDEEMNLIAPHIPNII
jgi:hypothetical protein